MGQIKNIKLHIVTDIKGYIFLTSRVIMSSEEHGFDEEFIDVPADYLKCVVCQFVLRDPIQITTCGHHYCFKCFERIKEYSVHFNSDLCCPIDRTMIDLSKVCKDIFIARAIDNLHVKCTFNKQGCTWNGELRDLEVHRGRCSYAVKEHAADQAGCAGGEVAS